MTLIYFGNLKKMVCDRNNKHNLKLSLTPDTNWIERRLSFVWWSSVFEPSIPGVSLTPDTNWPFSVGVLQVDHGEPQLYQRQRGLSHDGRAGLAVEGLAGRWQAPVEPQRAEGHDRRRRGSARLHRSASVGGLPCLWRRREDVVRKTMFCQGKTGTPRRGRRSEQVFLLRNIQQMRAKHWYLNTSSSTA